MIEDDDKLLGQWQTNNDSGIHVLYGSMIEFSKNGKGKLYSWGGSDDPDCPDDPKYDYEIPIDWARIDNQAIKIKKQNDLEWTILRYEMTPYMGYVKQQKIISINNHSTDGQIKEWFWNIPEALYKEEK